MQNTPTGSGNDLPILLRNMFFIVFPAIGGLAARDSGVSRSMEVLLWLLFFTVSDI